MSFLKCLVLAFCACAVNSQSTEVCVSPGRIFGRCINIFSCPALLQILPETRSNSGLANYLRTTLCGFEGSTPKVCCPNAGTIPSLPVENEYPDGYCGITNLTLTKIVGGIDAGPGDLPWMALLGYTGRDEMETGRPEWRCGGALVSAFHVVTAAHCIDDRLYLVRLGEVDVASEIEGAVPVDYRIERKIVHPEYDPVARVGDIAILKLQGNVKFNDQTIPICLPLSPQLRSNSFTRYRPLIAGWGSLKYAGDTATKLQMVQLPVTSTEECQQAYSRHSSNRVDEHVVCAGYPEGGQDSCDGDSGGPLMQPIRDQTTETNVWYLIGVLSYGVKCAEPGYPSVFMRVTTYIPWIQEKLTIANRLLK